MSRPVKILAFASSARRESFNKKLVRVAAQAAREAGAEVTLLDLAELPLPLFDQDLEAAEGLPENARQLKALMAEHDGFLISSPEYNSSITPLLKNAIAAVAEGDVTIVDSASTTAAVVARTLQESRRCRGSKQQGGARFLATDGATRFARVGGQFLGRELAHSDVELVDL